MFDKRWPRPRYLILAGLAAAVLMPGIVRSPSGLAQNRSDPDQREQPPESPRDRDRDQDRDRSRRDENGRDRRTNQPERSRGRGFPPQNRRAPEGTEEGMPELQLAPRRDRDRFHDPRWRLGVYAYDTNTGVRITRVLPETPAWRAGLERGDQIITVDGYQIGIVNGRLYPLGEELQRRADREGDVTLLVQNVRNGRLVNVDVGLERRRFFRRP